MELARKLGDTLIMKTRIDLNDEALELAAKELRTTTTQDTVNAALEFVAGRRRRIEQLLDDPHALGLGPDIEDADVMREARRCRPVRPALPDRHQQSLSRVFCSRPPVIPFLKVPAGGKRCVVLQRGDPSARRQLSEGEINGVLFRRSAGQPHGLGEGVLVDIDLRQSHSALQVSCAVDLAVLVGAERINSMGPVLGLGPAAQRLGLLSWPAPDPGPRSARRSLPGRLTGAAGSR